MDHLNEKRKEKRRYTVLIDLFALCSLDLPFALRVSIVLFFCPRYNILYLSLYILLAMRSVFSFQFSAELRFLHERKCFSIRHHFFLSA